MRIEMLHHRIKESQAEEICIDLQWLLLLMGPVDAMFYESILYENPIFSGFSIRAVKVGSGSSNSIHIAIHILILIHIVIHILILIHILIHILIRICVLIFVHIRFLIYFWFTLWF